MYHFDWAVFWQYLNPLTALQDPLIRGGLVATIMMSIVAQAFGVLFGLFAALAKMSKFAPFRIVSDAYIWYFRGTPLLVQMSLLFFGFGVTHIYDFPDIVFGGFTIGGGLQAAIVALAINEGAYMAEIVRAGIEAVDPGQMEAAKSLGMTYGQAMQRIVLPQAAKVIIPPLGNEFNNMMKTTSLAVIVSAGELYFGYTQVNARLFKPFELFIAASFYYLAMTTVWTVIQTWIEGQLGERKGIEKAPGVFERLFSGAGAGMTVGKGVR